MVDRKTKKRQKQKKADAKKKHVADKKRRQEKSLLEIRETGKKIKPYLRKVGCDLPFYDYIDHYEPQFTGIVRDALKERSSLIAVHEVAPTTLDDTDWSELGYGNLRQVFFSIPDECADYVKSDAQANLRGSATFFKSEDGSMKSVVLVQKRLKGSDNTREFQYAMKLPALVHEIGHVIDAEQELNIRFSGEEMDVIAAEVFAHVYALDQLASRCLRQSYLSLYEALARIADAPGYIGEIGRGVLDQHERVDIPNWRDFTDAALEYYQDTLAE